MSPWAKMASQQTGLDANLIMAQWGIETGWGTSYQWNQNHNPAGIGITSDAVQGQYYGGIQGGVQAYVDFINNNPRYQAVIHAGDATAQAEAMANSGYAAGKYTDNSGKVGGSLLETMAALGTNVNNAEAMTNVAGSTTAAAAPTGTGTGGSNATPPESLNINGVAYSGQGTPDQVSATQTLSSTLQGYGFSGNDLTSLTQWAWNEITSGTAPSQAALDIQNLPQFENRFPGLKERTAAGFDAMSVSDYLTYETAAQQQARALGLPDGFMSNQEIGSLIAGNVSAQELSDRLNNIYVVANNATPEVKAQLNAYFGYDVTPGGLAALALDPTKAEPLLRQQVTAAQLGGAGVTAGLGAVSEPLAMQIAQTGITASDIQSGIGALAPLAPLENKLPGQTTDSATGANVVSTDQLAKGQFLNSQQDQRALQVAQEARKAPFTGGGGIVQNAKGAVGAGSAANQGSPSSGQ